METARLIIGAFTDLFVRILPFITKLDPPGFAFIVHPRNYPDVQRKYPFFKYIPERVGLFMLTYFWPVVLCRITGVFTFKSKKPLTGWIITIPLVPDQMIENRMLAVRMIKKSLILASKKGAKIVGLGALTASFTKRGEDLKDVLQKYNLGLTTGVGYTTFNIVENVDELVHITKRKKSRILVAIVGAAGSIGSSCALYLAYRGYKNFLFIDLEHKNKRLLRLMQTLKNNYPAIAITINHQINAIKDADVVITATNAPEAMVREDDLKPGAIVVDDAQPSDIHPDVIKNRKDVIIAEGGAAHASKIHVPFNFGLKDRKDIFSCLAETAILAADETWDAQIFGKADIAYISYVSERGKDLKLKLAHFQNPHGKISRRLINKMVSIS